MADATVTPRKRPNDTDTDSGEQVAAAAAAPAPATAASTTTTPAGTASPASPARKKKPSFSKRGKLATAVARGQVGRVRVLVVELQAEMGMAHPAAYLAMLRYYASMAAMYQPDGDDTILDIFLDRLPGWVRLNALSDEDAAAAEEVRPLMGALGGDDGTVPATAAGEELLEYLQCPVYMAITWRRSARALRLLGRPNDPADPPLRHAEYAGERRLLHDACRRGLAPVVKALVAWPHAVPVLGNVVNGSTPLCVALKLDRPNVVRALCQHLRAAHGEPWWADVVDNLRGAPCAPGERGWASAYLCLYWDSLEALQALLAELPDGGKGFFASLSPKAVDGLARSPVEVAAGHASLQCLKWLVKEHGALRPPVPPLLHALASGTGVQEEGECLAVAKYLVEECGVDAGVLVKGKTAAEVAARFDRMRLHEYLTRGKRAAEADEAAEALLAELEAEEERKARKQQQKKKKKKKDKNKKAATTTEATDAKVAALEQATGKLLAFAFDGNGDEEADEVNPGATTATTDAGEDRKIPAPTAAGATPPKKKRERKKNPKPPTTTTTSIPESEGRGQQGKGSGKAAVATAAAATAAGAPPGRAPPTAAGDCSAAAVAFLSSPAKAKAKAAAAQDPRELAFLLKRARREDKCPLSGALLTDPVIASDGITYDRAALHAFAAAEAAEDRPLLSPVTGQPIARVFFPNQNVKRLVETAVEELQAEWRRPGRR